MDYKQLAMRIASSESPYEEFNKEASEMGELSRTALAREVNKQMFLSRLSGADGDIAFDVIAPGMVGTHEKSEEPLAVTKTASLEEPADKRALLDDSMFVLSRTVSRDSIRSSHGGQSSHLEKMAEHIMDTNHEHVSFQAKRHLAETKARAIASINDAIGVSVEQLVKVANDASELRTVMWHAIENGAANVIPEMIAVSNDSESTIQKVASAPLTADQERDSNSISISIASLYSMKDAVVASTDVEDIEKIASPLMSIAKALGGTAKKTGSMALGAGKLIMKHPKKLAGVAVASSIIPEANKHEEYIRRSIL